MENQLPRGLSLRDINEEYSNDEYRMRRSKRIHGDDVKKSNSNSEELYAEPFQIEYNTFNLFKKPNLNANEQNSNRNLNQSDEELESKFNKLHTIDERPESRMSEIHNEQNRKISLKNVAKKLEFATKLRANASEIKAKRNNSIPSRKVEPGKNATRSKSNDSQTSGSSETDSSYYEVKPPQPKKKSINPDDARRVSNINNLRKPTQGVQPKKIEVQNDGEDDKMKKLRAFQMQGFHPYYDNVSII